MGRSSASALTFSASQLRHDLVTVLRSAIDAVNAGLLVRRTLDDRETRVAIQRAAALDVIAAGKAAATMIEACAAAADVPLRTLLAIGPRRGPESSVTLPPSTIWYDAGHPLPGKLHQAQFILPKGTKWQGLKLKAELEVKGMRYPVRWACHQKTNDDGSLTLRSNRRDEV